MYCSIAIHSTREGGDMWLHPVLSAYGHFNPLHPRRRRRLNQLAWGDNQADFNPLHPRRRRRCKSYGAGSATEISIHSTREGGDANGPAYDDYMNQFQSTPPAKAETIAEPSEKLYSLISIHSTREGGDYSCNRTR